MSLYGEEWLEPTDNFDYNASMEHQRWRCGNCSLIVTAKLARLKNTGGFEYTARMKRQCQQCGGNCSLKLNIDYALKKAVILKTTAAPITMCAWNTKVNENRAFLSLFY